MWLHKWQGERRQLQEAEKKLHAGMHPEVAQVLEGKNILVFSKMLHSIGYADTGLCTEIAMGFRLTGAAAPSHVFPQKIRDSSLSVEELVEMAPWLRQRFD